MRALTPLQGAATDRTGPRASLRRRGEHLVARRQTGETDGGFTLVELLVALTTFIILITLVSVSVDMFVNVSTQVTTSYANSDQILPVATSIQRLIRTEVEPGPALTATSAPNPPFVVGAESTTSATFYANVGVAGQPARVVAALTGTTFTVTEQLADAGSCPTSITSNALCTFTKNPVTQVASMANVVNGTYPSAADPTPVFTYTLLDTSAGGAGIQIPVTDPATTFTTCTYSSDLATTCPYDTVEGVEIDLLVKSPGSRSLVPAEDDTTVYRLSSSSFLYSPTVG
jgi:type II secretory pathway pseudopilin PulG